MVTATATRIVTARNAPLDPLIFTPSRLVSNVGSRRSRTRHAAGYMRVHASLSLYRAIPYHQTYDSLIVMNDNINGPSPK